MVEQVTDQTLVERVQHGDKKAFDLLVIKYQQRVASVISRYMRSYPDDVLDVAQEAFIKAYRALPSFRGDSAFYTWLYRIVINTAKNHLVAQARRPPATDVDAEDAVYYETSRLHDHDTPESRLLTDEIEQVIFKTIESLPDDLRVAITLREMEDMSYEEIAEAMDCPIGTVRSRIFRAREAIDKQLKPLLSDI